MYKENLASPPLIPDNAVQISAKKILRACPICWKLHKIIANSNSGRERRETESKPASFFLPGEIRRLGAFVYHEVVKYS